MKNLPRIRIPRRISALPWGLCGRRDYFNPSNDQWTDVHCLRQLERNTTRNSAGKKGKGKLLARDASNDLRSGTVRSTSGSFDRHICKHRKWEKYRVTYHRESTSRIRVRRLVMPRSRLCRLCRVCSRYRYQARYRDLLAYLPRNDDIVDSATLARSRSGYSFDQLREDRRRGIRERIRRWQSPMTVLISDWSRLFRKEEEARKEKGRKGEESERKTRWRGTRVRQRTVRRSSRDRCGTTG